MSKQLLILLKTYTIGEHTKTGSVVEDLLDNIMCVQLYSDLCTTPLLYHTHTFQVGYVGMLGSTAMLIVIVGRKPEAYF